MSSRAIALGLLAAVVASACGPGPDAPDGGRTPGTADAPSADAPATVWFEDRAEDAGLLFTYASGHGVGLDPAEPPPYHMPEIMGGGVALLDADGDGRLDVYLVQGGHVSGIWAPHGPPRNRLYLNQGDLRFREATDSDADDPGYGMGATAGDLDNDGDVDLYVTNLGPNALLLNDGSAHFTAAGEASGALDPGWGTSAAAVDHDHDGDLDLFVVNYLDWTAAGELTCHNELGTRDYCSPQNYESPALDVLLENDGTATFTDVSEAAGITAEPGTGLGIGCADFDGDGRIDVFVANDGMPDVLWRNRGDGTFENIALLAGCAVDHGGRSKAGMGVAVSDVDDDGLPDLMVCNLDRQTDSFFLNQGGWFRDETPRAGLAVRSRSFTRFGMGLRDFDLDGRLDLFQANGRVTRRAKLYTDDPYAEPDLLQRGVPGEGDGPPRFEAAPTLDGTAEPPAWTGRAAAFGDLDDDGGIDIVVVNRDGPVRLMHNVVAARGAAGGAAGAAAGGAAGGAGGATGTDGPWVGFRVLDGHGRDALGATVRLMAGTRTMTRDVRVASSYLASNDPRVHFGLGADGIAAGRDAVAEVTVTWIDGTVESFGDRATGRYHELRAGQGDARR